MLPNPIYQKRRFTPKFHVGQKVKIRLGGSDFDTHGSEGEVIRVIPIDGFPPEYAVKAKVPRAGGKFTVTDWQALEEWLRPEMEENPIYRKKRPRRADNRPGHRQIIDPDLFRRMPPDALRRLLDAGVITQEQFDRLSRYSGNPPYQYGPWPGEDPAQGEMVIDAHPKAATYGKPAVVKEKRHLLYLLRFRDGTESWRTPLQVRRMPGYFKKYDKNPSPGGMQSCYLDKETRAIADLVDYYSLGMLITRINVPAQARGKGAGSKLLKQIIADADRTHTTLFLEVVPTGGMTAEQLAAWYGRYGFAPWRGGFLRRRPGKMSSNPGIGGFMVKVFASGNYYAERALDELVKRGMNRSDFKIIMDFPQHGDASLLTRSYEHDQQAWKIGRDVLEDPMDSQGITFDENPIYRKTRPISKFKIGDVVSTVRLSGGNRVGRVISVHEPDKISDEHSYTIEYRTGEWSQFYESGLRLAAREEVPWRWLQDNPIYQKRRPKFKVGDIVRVTSGEFEDEEGDIRSITGFAMTEPSQLIHKVAVSKPGGVFLREFYEHELELISRYSTNPIYRKTRPANKFKIGDVVYTVNLSGRHNVGRVAGFYSPDKRHDEYLYQIKYRNGEFAQLYERHLRMATHEELVEYGYLDNPIYQKRRRPPDDPLSDLHYGDHVVVTGGHAKGVDGTITSLSVPGQLRMEKYAMVKDSMGRSYAVRKDHLRKTSLTTPPESEERDFWTSRA